MIYFVVLIVMLFCGIRAIWTDRLMLAALCDGIETRLVKALSVVAFNLTVFACDLLPGCKPTALVVRWHERSRAAVAGDLTSARRIVSVLQGLSLGNSLTR